MDLIKGQKGFTIIELITSFSLTMVVLIFLFNVVIILKETYVYDSTKGDLIMNQNLLSSALNEDLYNNATSFNTITPSSDCPDGYSECYSIKLKNGNYKNLSISTTNNKIKYGAVEYVFEDSVFSNVNICKQEYTGASDLVNSLLIIKVQINSEIIESNEFGINVLHLYNPSIFETDISDC